MPRKSEKNKIFDFLVYQTILDLCFADSSDEEEQVMDDFMEDALTLLCHRKATHLLDVTRIRYDRNINGNVLHNFTDAQYKKLFGMDSFQFHHILKLVAQDDSFENARPTQLPVKLQLQIMLFRLGGATIRKTAITFGIGDGGTINRATERIFKAILKLRKNYIKWPNTKERANIVKQSMNDLPGCIGYLGCMGMKLDLTPQKDRELYWSKLRKQYSLNVQIIADCNLKIRQISLVYPGRVQEASIFSTCAIAKQPDKYFSNLQWLAAGAMYKTTSTVLTPFSTRSTECPKEKCAKFNQCFEKRHGSIENCYNQLQQMFPSLKCWIYRCGRAENNKRCYEWTVVCCILYNILKFNENDMYMDSGQDLQALQYPNEMLECNNLRLGLCHYLNRKDTE